MKKIILLSTVLIFNFCSDQKKVKNSKIEIYDQSIESIIDIYNEFEILADSITLPEGPAWDETTKSLLFVDVINDKILKWNEAEGVSEYISPAGNTGYAPNLGQGLLGPNGMTFDNNGNLLVCQHGDRRIALIKNTQNNKTNFETVIDSYNDKRFNSPNDLTVASDGSIYFTDPPFSFFDLNTFSFVESELRELNFSGVFKFDPSTKIVTAISEEIRVPNGLGLSPDEKFLYVNKMGKPFSSTKSKILKIDLSNLGVETLFEGEDLFEKYKDGSDFDGMAVHSSGNIFTSGPGGLLVISPNGKLMAKLDFSHITNCTFDSNEKYLYVTGFLDNPKVYRIKLKEN